MFCTISIDNCPNYMKSEEFKRVYKKYKNGDKQFRTFLICQNTGIIKYIVNHKLNNLPYEKEELFSVGLIGLIKAIDNYTLEKKISFYTFASTCIINEILMFCRKNRKHFTNVCSLGTSIKEDFCLQDVIASDFNLEETYLNKEEYGDLHRIMNELDPDDQQLLKLRFGFMGRVYTQQEIADMLGCSQTTIYRKIQKLLIIIKEKLTNEKELIYKQLN